MAPCLFKCRQLTEAAILMVADRESAHFLRLYKTEFTNFLDEYKR
jgi:hypothetical protein